MAKFTEILTLLRRSLASPAPVRQDHAESLPRNMRGAVSSAGSFFGFYSPRIGRAFEPTPYNPDDLVQRKGLKIYRKMAQDEQIKAALAAKQYAVLSTGYDILLPDLPEDADQATADAAEEQKEFIEFNFGEMKGGIESKLLSIMDAMTFGFSCSEKIYDVINYGQFEGKWMLKDLRTRPPEDIEFQIDSMGNLDPMGVLQFDTPLPAEKFVIFSYDSKYNNFYGNSDLRAAYRAWWLKDEMLKSMAMALERFAEPISDVSWDGNIDDDTRADMQAFIKNLQGRSGVFHPKNIELQFHTPPPNADVFISAINLYDQGIRIAILVPGLMGLSSDQKTGSLARSQTEFDVFLWILGQLRKDLELVANEQIIKPLIDLNFEVVHGQYPKFKFNEVTEEARHKAFELFLMGLTSSALQLGPDDQNKLRELINFEPLPDDFVQVDPKTGYEPGEQPSPEEEMRLRAEILGAGKPGFGGKKEGGKKDE